MSLTPRQLAHHWQLWSRAKAVLMPGRSTWTKYEENELRHTLYREALGADKSLTEFTNADFDKVKAAMLAIIEPGDLSAQLRQLSQERNRLLYGIRRMVRELGAGEAYVQAIIERMNAEGDLGGNDLEELAPADLRKVMVALRQHERRGGGTVAEPVGCLDAQTSEEPF